MDASNEESIDFSTGADIVSSSLPEAPFLFIGCIGDLGVRVKHDVSAGDCAILSGYSYWRVFHPVVDTWTPAGEACFRAMEALPGGGRVVFVDRLPTPKYCTAPAGFELMRDKVEVLLPQHLSLYLPDDVSAALIAGIPNLLFGDALLTETDDNVRQAGNRVAGRQIVSRESGTQYYMQGIHTMYRRFGRMGCAVPAAQLWLAQDLPLATLLKEAMQYFQKKPRQQTGGAAPVAAAAAAPAAAVACEAEIITAPAKASKKAGKWSMGW